MDTAKLFGLAKPQLKAATVRLPDGDTETIWVQYLTAKQVKLLRAGLPEDEASSEGQFAYTCQVIAAAVMNEDGTPLVPEDQVEDLFGLPFMLINQMAEAVMQINGMAGDSVGEDAEGN